MIAAERDLESGTVDTDATHNDSVSDGNEKTTPVDPNIVDWDGPNDPKNPRNWSKSFMFTNVFIVSGLSLTAYGSPAIPSTQQ